MKRLLVKTLRRMGNRSNSLLFVTDTMTVLPPSPVGDEYTLLMFAPAPQALIAGAALLEFAL
jgi:hypothetical protein